MKHTILFLISLLVAIGAQGVVSIPLNNDWSFHRGFQASPSGILSVNLPHTWNAADGMFGNTDYYRGLCSYSRKMPGSVCS